MFYGDPALRIHVPPSGCVDQPPEVQVSGTKVTVSAPETLWCFELPDEYHWNHKDWGYDCFGPGLAGSGIYEAGKRYIATFTTDRPVSTIEQTSTVPADLGWSGRYGCDERPDGLTTCYHDLCFEEVDYHNSCTVLREVAKVSFSFE